MIQWIKLVGEQFTWFDFNITFVLFNTGKYINYLLIIYGIHIKTFKYICNLILKAQLLVLFTFTWWLIVFIL